MRILIWIACFTMFILWVMSMLASCVYAGTTLQNLSTSTVYIKLDEIAEQRREAKELSEKVLSKDELRRLKEKAEEVLKDSDKASSAVFYEWILREIERNIEEPNLFHLDMALVSEQVKRFGEDPEFFNKHDRNDLRLAVKAKDYVKARQLVNDATGRMNPGASSSVEEIERFDKIKQMKNNKSYVLTEINRWISELISEENDQLSKMDNTQKIMFLQDVKKQYLSGRDIGASVHTSSTTIKMWHP